MRDLSNVTNSLAEVLIICDPAVFTTVSCEAISTIFNRFMLIDIAVFPESFTTELGAEDRMGMVSLESGNIGFYM